MYLEYFGLSEAPFSITPDPAFIYLSQRHRDALAHLLFGIGQGGSGGFVQLTGEVGTGKTTLCRALLEQVPEQTRIALILNPMVNSTELLEAICEELGIDTAGAGHGSKALVDRLSSYLLDIHQQGGRVVVVIDEAQNLGTEALEQIRLLTNLETSKEKLLQIILLGQPELRELLRRQSLRQLAQRITARYHLTPLGVEDTARYVRHRLEVAGAVRCPFNRSSLRALYRRSQGVPRLINIIADRALVGAFAAERQSVDARLVNAAADEVQFGEPGVATRRWPAWALGATAAVLLAFAVAWWLPARQDLPRAPAAAAQASPDVARPGPEQGPGPASAPPPARVSAPPAGPASSPMPEAAWLREQDDRAWTLLADTWGRAEDAALLEAACRGRSGLGYGCVREQGNLGRIRQLGLPVVLVLPNRSGSQPAEQHLFLGGVEATRMLLGGEPEQRLVERDDLEPHWLGDYYVAWPQASNWPREIQRGDRGPAVETVLRLASRADEPYQGAPEFGAGLEQWLRQFQARNGLEVDGIVGPRTLLYLMRFSIEEPRLLTEVDLQSGRT